MKTHCPFLICLGINYCHYFAIFIVSIFFLFSTLWPSTANVWNLKSFKHYLSILYCMLFISKATPIWHTYWMPIFISTNRTPLKPPKTTPPTTLATTKTIINTVTATTRTKSISSNRPSISLIWKTPHVKLPSNLVEVFPVIPPPTLRSLHLPQVLLLVARVLVHLVAVVIRFKTSCNTLKRKEHLLIRYLFGWTKTS